MSTGHQLLLTAYLLVFAVLVIISLDRATTRRTEARILICAPIWPLVAVVLAVYALLLLLDGFFKWLVRVWRTADLP